MRIFKFFAPFVTAVAMTAVAPGSSSFAASNFDGAYKWTLADQCTNGDKINGDVSFSIKDNVVTYTWPGRGGADSVISTAPVAQDGTFELSRDLSPFKTVHIRDTINAKVAGDGAVSGHQAGQIKSSSGSYTCDGTLAGKRR